MGMILLRRNVVDITKKKGVDFTFVVKTKEGLNKRSSADDCLEAFHWRYGEKIPMLL